MLLVLCVSNISMCGNHLAVTLKGRFLNQEVWGKA